MKKQNEKTNVVRLPLWKSCVETMIAEGVTWGSTYKTEFFEEHLMTKRDALQFSFMISDIRKELENFGMYLSGRGQKGNSYIILPSSSNSDVMDSYQKEASQALRRGVILGTNTPLDTLTPSERKKHESKLEKMAMKSCLMNRSTQIYRAVIKHVPNLINEKEEGDQSAAQ